MSLGLNQNGNELFTHKYKQIINLKLLGGLLVASCLLFTSIAGAHNKVVLIPMSGDDVRPLKNIITVAKKNGDFTSPVTALNSIMGAAHNNAYLIVIAPGVYTLTSQQLVMKQYVDITGSGQNVTILKGSKSSASRSSSAAVVVGANNSKISNLTIQNTDSVFSVSTYAIGIFNGGASPTIQDTTISVTAGKNFQYGIYNVNTVASIAAPKLSDLTILVTGANNSQTGVFNNRDVGAVLGRGPTLMNLRITVEGGAGTEYGVYNFSSNNSVMMSNSRISAATASIRAFTGSATDETYISNSLLNGPVTGDPKCKFVFTFASTVLDSGCQ